MSSGTIGRMKVLAIKGIEKQGDLWAVRYTREHGKNVQNALWLCDTPDEAKAKYHELLDVLKHYDGMYIGKKEKKKLKISGSKSAR